MLKGFIVIDNDKLGKDRDIRLNIADLYAKIYSAAPWYEKWTRESALAELDEVKEKQGFVGVLASLEDKLIGFSWGYDIPLENTSRVDFDKIRRELLTKNLDLNKAFYAAETGVELDFRRQGIGRLLVKERLRATKGKEFILYRTKNPQIINIYRTLFGNELFSFPEESAYKDGRIYVVKVEK